MFSAALPGAARETIAWPREVMIDAAFWLGSAFVLGFSTGAAFGAWWASRPPSE